MLDFDFLDDPDFGLAKTISKAPVGQFMPEIDQDMYSNEMEDFDNPCFSNEIKSDHFCFKLAPNQDVLTNFVKTHSSKLNSKSSSTTWLLK